MGKGGEDPTPFGFLRAEPSRLAPLMVGQWMKAGPGNLFPDG